MADKQLNPPVRILLWCTPRSLSTVFLKCISNIEGIQVISEAYIFAWGNGPESLLPKDPELQKKTTMFKELAEKVHMDLSNAFEESQCTYKWVKEQLEADYPGKKFVFCQDKAIGIHGRYQDLPRSYRHTFLIRNPVKMWVSWRKIIMKGFVNTDEEHAKATLDTLPYADALFYDELYHLLQYMKEQSEQKPVVIDADDLLTNPASVLRQYCEAVGLPFNESLLEWKAGDDCTSNWIAPKLFVLGNRVEEFGGYYAAAFASTKFHPPRDAPPRNHLTPDVLSRVEKCMKWYQEMYDMRIKPY